MNAIGCPSYTTSPTATVSCRRIPPTSDLIRCSIFIESITNICWPSRTGSPSATVISRIVPCSGDRTAVVFGGPTMTGAGCAPGAVATCPSRVPDPSRK